MSHAAAATGMPGPAAAATAAAAAHHQCQLGLGSCVTRDSAREGLGSIGRVCVGVIGEVTVEDEARARLVTMHQQPGAALRRGRLDLDS